MRHALPVVIAVAAAGAPAAVAAQTDEAPELWLNPSVTWSLDEAHSVRLDTAQRFRRESDGRPDTYYAQLWLDRDLSDALVLSGGVERRLNEPGADETRLMQQLSGCRGVLRARRVTLEAGRMRAEPRRDRERDPAPQRLVARRASGTRSRRATRVTRVVEGCVEGPQPWERLDRAGPRARVAYGADRARRVGELL